MMARNLIFLLAILVCGKMAAQTTADPIQSNETRKTVELFLKYLGEKNPEKIGSMVAENVDWYIFESKAFPWTGRRTKSSQIPEVFRTLFSYFVDGKEQFELDSFLADGNHAAVFGTLSRAFKSNGKTFTMLVAIHFKIEKNLITQFTLYEQTPVLEQAFTDR